MRREELALVILGELDESFIDEAMPKKKRLSAPGMIPPVCSTRR